MKQIIFRFFITAIILIALIQSGAINALFMLFVAGMIPGTEFVIPANIMMLMYCAIMCAILLYATARDILRSIYVHHFAASNDNSKNTPTQAAL